MEGRFLASFADKLLLGALLVIPLVYYKRMYFAHDGVDHSTGAMHEPTPASSRENVNSITSVIGVTIVAGVALVGVILLVKKTMLASASIKEKKK